MTNRTLTTTEIRRHVERLPRVSLAHLPTALDELPRLSACLGGPRLFIKRDDCTGLAFGGNKTRHNEFVLADALDQGADMLVWGAGVQSNNCRQTAAACAKLGLDCQLILSRAYHKNEVQGNLLLDHLCGATIEIVDDVIGPELDSRISQSADQFRRKGRRVYGMNRRRVKVMAAVSYVLAMAELVDQLDALDIKPSAVYVCSGGSTGAGMALGKAAMGLSFALLNILPIRWPWDEQSNLAQIANETAKVLELPQRLDTADINITDAFVGPDYAVPTPKGMEAISLMASREGIMLDPVYTAKAMGAMIYHVREGRYTGDESVVFVHTGGTPVLFSYRDDLVRMIPSRKGET